MKEKVFSRKFSESLVKDNYSKVAWIYDFWSWLTESKAAKRVIELASIKDGEFILEVAVGTGSVFKEIVKQNPQGINEGLDISDAMLKRAYKKLRNFDNQNIRLQIGNAYELPFNENTFNLVVNNFMIDLLPEDDFEKVLVEFYRVLKSSGRVVISTMAFGKKWYNSIWHWIAKKFPKILTGCRPISLKSYLHNTGFVEIEVEHISHNTFPSEILFAKKPFYPGTIDADGNY